MSTHAEPLTYKSDGDPQTGGDEPSANVEYQELHKGALFELEPQAPPPHIWTKAAWSFFLSILGFVLPTAIMLIYVDVITTTKLKGQPILFLDNAVITASTVAQELFLLFTAYRAILDRNMVAVVGSLVFNIHLVLSGFLEAWRRSAPIIRQVLPDGRVEIWHISDGVKWGGDTLVPLLWAVPAIDLCFHIVGDLSAYRLYRELGWASYRSISASVVLRLYYRRYLVLSTLSLYSAFFALLQAYVLIAEFKWFSLMESYADPLVTAKPDWHRFDDGIQWSIFLVAPIFAVGYSVALWLQLRAVRSESQLATQTCVIAQLVYLLWSAYTTYCTFALSFAPLVWLPQPSLDSWVYDLSGFMVIPRFVWQALLADVLVVATLVCSVLAMRGFGTGLKARYSNVKVLPNQQTVNLSAC